MKSQENLQQATFSFSFFFSEKIRHVTACQADASHEMSSLIYSEIKKKEKKKEIKMLSAAIVIGALRVNKRGTPGVYLLAIPEVVHLISHPLWLLFVIEAITHTGIATGTKGVT